MNSFSRTAIFLCMGLIVFTLSINFLNLLGVFPVSVSSGMNSEDSTVSYFASFSTTSMDYLWGLVLSASMLVGGLVSYFTHSVAPLGISIFSSVFWTSYLRALSILDVGGYISGNLPGFMLIFTVAIVFVFIAAVIGMLTG